MMSKTTQIPLEANQDKDQDKNQDKDQDKDQDKNLSKEEKSQSETPLSSSPQRLLQGRPLLREGDRVIVNIWSSEDNKAVPGVNVGHVSLETSDKYMSLWPAPRTASQSSHLPPSVLQQLQRSLTKYFEKRPPLWKASYLEDCVSEAVCEKKYRRIRYVNECVKNEKAVAITEDGLVIVESSDMPIPDGATLLAVPPSHATVRLVLYSLKIGEVHAQLERLEKNIVGWRLMGSNSLTRVAAGTSEENCASLVYRLLTAGGMYRGMLGLRGSSENASVATPDQLIKHVMAAKRWEREKHPEICEWAFAGESDLTKLEKAHGIVSSEDREVSFLARFGK